MTDKTTIANKLRDNSPVSLELAGEALRQGDLVVIPTETVYGLGANALDAQACAKIFAAKQRPFFDPLICHIASPDMLSLLTNDVSKTVQSLMERFWPGPLTIVCTKKDAVPSIVTSGLPTVAIRFPAHADAQKIIHNAGIPVAAPSANLFGRLSPTRAAHTLDLLDSVAMIIDGGPCTVGVESTIVRELDGRLYLLRPGGIAGEAIEDCAKTKLLDAAKDGPVDAPGQLPSHYAPLSPLVLIDEGEDVDFCENACLLAFRRNDRKKRFAGCAILSESGDLNLAATRLFDELHNLDQMNPSRIYAERVPMYGLGLAIMDRLQKAAAHGRSE